MAQVSLKDITGPLLSVLLLLAGASPAAARINHSPAGERRRHPDRSAAGAVPSDQNRYYGGGVSIRVLGASYGRNVNTNFTDDLARQCQGRDYCVYRIDARQAIPGPAAPRTIRRATCAATAAMSATLRRAPRPPASRSCWTAAASSNLQPCKQVLS
jgi:hypothetical protein